MDRRRLTASRADIITLIDCFAALIPAPTEVAAFVVRGRDLERWRVCDDLSQQGHSIIAETLSVISAERKYVGKLNFQYPVARPDIKRQKKTISISCG